MWVLENDGDVFHGKKLWLRPGKRYIFGRTVPDAGAFIIENKSISRKHLVIEVDSVAPGDASLLHKRSHITLMDLKTKMGTLVNEVQIRGQSHVLEGDRHDIKLGQFGQLFRIIWQPVVLSFSLSAKEMKSKVVDQFYDRLEPLDVKVLVDYDHDNTTHVVAKRRNTSKGLQALINGRFIVDYTFIDAIEAASRVEADDGTLLEKDFYLNWPDALRYLPPRGHEPTQRPENSYAPDITRQDIFDGYTFIFCERSQFDNLLAPITNGKGKALLHQIDASTTKVDEFVRYVKSVAGEKGVGEFEDGSEGKGVVVVRYQPGKGETHSWYVDFLREVAQSLDHRLVEQNEFLDAILNNDASVLRKPLDFERPDAVAPPSTAAALPLSYMGNPSSTNITSQTMTGDMSTALSETPTPASVLAPVKRAGRSRRTVTSRFKGFDDDFDTPAIPDSSQVTNLQGTLSVSQQSGMFVLQDQGSEFDALSQAIVVEERPNLKRPSTFLENTEEEEDLMERLAPAAIGLKRQRLAEVARRRRDGGSTLQSLSSIAQPELLVSAEEPKKIKAKAEVDVLEVARQQREREEAIAKAEREDLQEAMEGMDIDEIHRLVVIEEMKVGRTNPPLRSTAHGDDGDRWNESWNGRKNFKKFRHRGQASRIAANRVIVPLEEVKKKDFGIGDEYWIKGNGRSQSRKKGHTKQNDSQDIRLPQAQTESIRQVDTIVAEIDAPIMDPPVQSERISASRSKTFSVDRNAIQNSSSQTKRSAAKPLVKPAPVKKARHDPVNEDSDDSDGGLGFKFRTRR